ncbi:hypothetical protein HMPREF3042_04955 [Corynebacterium sp. HMSC074C05]|uniref:hypothetical protein n=1 Tax=Corynebacterium sp. HMSC074C05 TaxID=1739534 RepID=UPI0008AA27D3|nr:hypothetical protein [Corynebacterium sp. HMSC074C05]OHR33125.1 hypothetical protein HMPREF3042_04955 [Corynebacterium sp. HMSC074C05]
MSKNAATVAVAATAVVGVGALVLTGALAGGSGSSAPSPTPADSVAEVCEGMFVDHGECQIAKARQAAEEACDFDPTDEFFADVRARQCESAQDRSVEVERLYGMPENPSDLQISPVTAPYAANTERVCMTYEDTVRSTGETLPSRCVVRLVST